jgi:phosphatidylethanolamine-binding protein (PEBP) family uncharacterized protein
MSYSPQITKRAGRLAVGSALVSLALAGCGSSASSSTTKKTPPKPIVPIKLAIAGVPAGHTVIPATFTCDGHNASIPLKWSGVPSNTKELVVLVANIGVVKGSHILSFVNWGVAGLNPALKAISSGKLPTGTVVGRNGYHKVGYSICPSKAHLTRNYAIQLLALSAHAKLKPGFNVKELVEEAEAGKVISGRGQLLVTYSSHKSST